MNIEYFNKRSNTNIFKKSLNKKNKRILLYQYDDYHTEISGFIFYNLSDYIFDVYYPHSNSSNNYFEYYCKIFNIKINYISYFNENNYLYIFILTSRNIIRFYTLSNRRYILFKHCNEDVYDSYFNISLTPLVNANLTMLPIYNYPNKNVRSNIICIIGNMSSPIVRDLEGIYKLLKIIKNYNIYIFTRKIEEKYKEKYLKFKHCKIYININTVNLIEKIRISKYILTADTDYYWSKGCKTGVLSGMIPLAFNNNIPLITSKNLNNIYKLNGVIEYENMENIDKIINYYDEYEYKKLLDKFMKCKEKILLENKKKLMKIII